MWGGCVGGVFGGLWSVVSVSGANWSGDEMKRQTTDVCEERR